jgi:hypothetical protein
MAGSSRLNSALENFTRFSPNAIVMRLTRLGVFAILISMSPRMFRFTAYLCLAALALDAVVSTLPHQHGDLSSKDVCTASACSHRHSHTSCQHSCSHQHASTCSHSHPPAPANPPTRGDEPCDHCSLCRHQAQAALPCTALPLLELLAYCAVLPDQQSPQVAAVVTHVYQGRGPPSAL